ncbi:hypothetical protein BDV27DRAFT_125598 [Aspergillus caelatus]|uniref:Uncharacterized protein n=1 Tax=Aspergillus caelatus TaxID=61420 RepID=A0A5N7A8V8_9EURO|nr:uncharacterized protein BDV27DRAFT_125598 [Aspergillus caelatus]KAE8366284.1 hypothetical protein BDV27DRAFT_125598 [Aspergillus caelatus]
MREIQTIEKKAVRPTVLWLCKEFVFSPWMSSIQTAGSSTTPLIIPGTNSYPQALNMLHDTYEEASLLPLS